MERIKIPAALPWIAPFASYLILTHIALTAPDGYYPWLYVMCTLVTAAFTAYLLLISNVVRPHRRILPGVVFGLIGIVLWIYLCGLGIDKQLAAMLPEWLRPEARAAFNPFEEISDPVLRWAFITIRVAGIALLVPVVEELFWRGWLMRWIVAHDWEKVPIGKFTPASFLWVTVLFTMAHPEWLAAAVWCALINLLLYWKKDLWNCMVAHGVSNLCLAVYVMAFDAWELW